MFQCSACHAELPAPTRFCRYCGAALGGTQVQGRTITMPETTVAARTIVNQPARAHDATALGPGRTTRHGTSVSTSSQREHLVLVGDVSGSMNEAYDGQRTKIEAAVRSAASLILEKRQIDADDRVGIVVFDNRADVLHPVVSLRQHHHELLAALQSQQAGGGTDINAGLKAARDLFDWNASGVVRRIVLLTDGHGGRPLRTAERLKAAGVVIDVVGVGKTPAGVDERLLRRVASTIEGEVYYCFIKDQGTLIEHCTRLAGKTVVAP